MPKLSAAQRRPWGVVVLLVILGFASEVLLAAPEATQATPAAAPQQAPEVKDTHQRLKRIYKRLGIRREARDAPKWNTGCGGNERSTKEGGGLEMLPSAPPAAIPAWLGYVLIGAVVVSLLVFVFLGMRQGRRDVQALPSILDEEEEGDPTEALYRPWRVTLEECCQLASEGKLIAAFAALHRLTLLALQERGDLRLEKTTTNWQYVRRLTSRPKLRRLLSEVTIAAERSVLGEHQLTEAEFQGLQRRVQQEVLDATL